VDQRRRGKLGWELIWPGNLRAKLFLQIRGKFIGEWILGPGRICRRVQSLKCPPANDLQCRAGKVPARLASQREAGRSSGEVGRGGRIKLESALPKELENLLKNARNT